MSAALSAPAFRSRFPVLERRVHLASCSIAARSSALDRALARMADDMTAGAAAWEVFEEQGERARRSFAALIGADAEQVALMPNASVGAYQVASSMDWRERPRAVSTVAEFPSIAQVWLAQRPRGARVVLAEDTDRVAGLVDERTRVVSVPLVTSRDGRRTDLAPIVAAARRAGAVVLVDAYQAVGVEPVDVGALGCDFLVAGTMKYLLGLPGLAFLYARAPTGTDRAPRLTGWFGRRDPFAPGPPVLDFPDTARRFETGTPAVPACYAAVAGLELLADVDLADVRAHVRALTELTTDRLRAQGETVRDVPADARGAHVALVDPRPAATARALAERGVSVSARDDVVRVAFHYFSTTDDVAALCAAVADHRGARPAGASTTEWRSHVHS